MQNALSMLSPLMSCQRMSPSKMWILYKLQEHQKRTCSTMPFASGKCFTTIICFVVYHHDHNFVDNSVLIAFLITLSNKNNALHQNHIHHVAQKIINCLAAVLQKKYGAFQNGFSLT